VGEQREEGRRIAPPSSLFSPPPSSLLRSDSNGFCTARKVLPSLSLGSGLVRRGKHAPELPPSFSFPSLSFSSFFRYGGLHRRTWIFAPSFSTRLPSLFLFSLSHPTKSWCEDHEKNLQISPFSHCNQTLAEGSQQSADARSFFPLSFPFSPPPLFPLAGAIEERPSAERPWRTPTSPSSRSVTSTFSPFPPFSPPPFSKKVRKKKGSPPSFARISNEATLFFFFSFPFLYLRIKRGKR